MKGYGLVFWYTRTALTVFALSALLLLSSIALVSYFSTIASTQLAQKRTILKDTRNDVHLLTNDLKSINTNLSDFNNLTRLGLLGEPDRETWAEQFNALYQATRLPPTLHYTLAAPASYSVSAQSGLQPQAQHHDLQFELSGIHEGEFLAFADKLAAEWPAPYRIENCAMQREDEGLEISCTLRLFSLPLPATNYTPDPH